MSSRGSSLDSSLESTPVEGTKPSDEPDLFEQTEKPEKTPSLTASGGLTLGTSLDVPTTAGGILKKARDRKDLSIEDCAKELRIRSQFLEALETENLSLLPSSRTTIRSYIKAYAKMLELDGEDILQKFNDAHYPTATSIVYKPKPLPSVPSGLVLYLLATILLLVFFVGVAQNFLWQNNNDNANTLLVPLPRHNHQDPSRPKAIVSIQNTEEKLKENLKENLIEQNIPIEKTEDNPVQQLVANTGMIRLENVQHLFVGLRGGSLDQDYYALLEANEGLELPSGEGLNIKLHMDDWPKVKFLFLGENSPPQQFDISPAPKDNVWISIDDYLPIAPLQ